MTMHTAPHSNADLWDREILRDPYAAYARLREQGPAIYLDRFDAWAIPRYEQVREVLGDWKRFTSSRGVALNKLVNDIPLRTVLTEDPPMHDQMRSVLSEQLSLKAILALREQVNRKAQAMADELVARGEFDAVTDLAEPFVIGLVAHLIGLEPSSWTRLSELSNSIFTVYGPDNAHTQENLPGAQAFFNFCAEEGARGRLRPGSWGAAIYAAADAGVVPQELCTGLMASYVGAGMDTTVALIGTTVWLFSQHPDQWDALRRDPQQLRNALNEVLRLEGPLQCLTRVNLVDYAAESVTIPAGSRLAILYASANRDERKWPEADVFDISRNTTGQLGFGHGLHQCAGQQLARLEAEAVIGALLPRVQRFVAGTPTIRHNNVVRGHEHLPVRVVAA